MIKFTPRAYQTRQAQRLIERIESPSKRKSLGIAPTAAGKSWIIALICQGLAKPTLVLQPDKNLLQQNVDKFIKATGQTPGIFSASAGSKTREDVTYATLLSILNTTNDHAALFSKWNVIVDEAHLYSPEKDSKNKKGSVFTHFIEKAKITNIAGLTATPFRLKTGGGRYDPFSRMVMLNRMRPGFFNEIVDVVQIQEMLDNNWWTPLKYHAMPYDRRDLKSNSSGSDYTELSNKKAFETNKVMEKAVKHALQGLERGRVKGLSFFPSIALAQQFAKLVPSAIAIHSKLSSQELKDAMNGWKSGKYKIIANVDMFTTGFDDPEIDMLQVCRSMMSMGLWYQIIGRGTRIDPLGIKKDCWVIDYCGNIEQFGKVEAFTVEDIPHYGWGVFGEGGRLLTDLRMDGSEKRHDKKIWTKDNCSQLQQYRASFYRETTL